MSNQTLGGKTRGGPGSVDEELPRVLLLSPLPPPYGGIAHWTTMVRNWVSTNKVIDLTIVDTAPKSRGQLEASRISRLVQGGARLPLELFRVLKSIRRQRPDVVHLNTSGQLAFIRDLLVAYLCRSRRIPLVYHVRFGRLPEARARNTWEWRLFSRAARQAATVITIDQATQEAAESLAQGNVARIPNFVDASAMKPIARESRQRVCLFVGWVIETKGILELIQAWKDMDLDGWQLELIGPIDDASSHRLSEKGVPASVIMRGPQDHAEVLARMRASAVFVFPSHTEGFPNAVAEAMAAGMPIVATAVGAIPEMLSQGAGVVVPPRDAAALSTEMRALLSDETRRASVGLRARERVCELYSEEAVMAQYVTEWSRLATGDHVAARRH